MRIFTANLTIWQNLYILFRPTPSDYAQQIATIFSYRINLSSTPQIFLLGYHITGITFHLLYVLLPSAPLSNHWWKHICSNRHIPLCLNLHLNYNYYILLLYFYDLHDCFFYYFFTFYIFIYISVTLTNDCSGTISH